MRSPRNLEARAISLSLGGIGSARTRRISLALSDRFDAIPVCWPRLTLHVVSTPGDAATMGGILAALNPSLLPLRVVVEDVAALPSSRDRSRLYLHCIAVASPGLLSLRREIGQALRQRGLTILGDMGDAWIPRIPLLSGRFPIADVAGMLTELREATLNYSFSARSIELSRQTREGRRVTESRWRLAR